MLRRLLCLFVGGCLSVFIGVSASNLDTAAVIAPIVETQSILDAETGDPVGVNAPKVWEHPYEKSQSLVISTTQDGRLAVFGLNGELKQLTEHVESKGSLFEPSYYVGVDIIPHFKMRNKWSDLVVVTDTANDTLHFFRINPWAYAKNIPPLENITSHHTPRLFSSGLSTVERHHAYDLATLVDDNDGALAIVSRQHETQLAQAHIILTAEGKITFESKLFYRLPDTFDSTAHKSWTPCFTQGNEKADIYGMTIDKNRKILYVSQRGVGIWKMPISAPNRSKLIDKTQTFGIPYVRKWVSDSAMYACELLTQPDLGLGGNIEGDGRLGLDIYYQNRRTGYLLASNSDSHVVSVYKRDGTHALVGQFKSQDDTLNGAMRGAEGVAIASANLGPQFPSGLIVVQDNQTVRKNGEAREEVTHLKFISWEDVAMSFESKLQHRKYSFSNVKKWRD